METNQLFEIWPGFLLFDLLRYLIPAGIAFLIFWVIGRKHWNHLFIQKVFPKQKQLWKEFLYSMSTVLIFSLVGLGVFTVEHLGITLIYHQISDYGVLYLVLSLVFAILFHDFYFYWTHRLMHHKSLFKYIHKVHHESVNPSPWAAYAFHPWEAVIQAMVLPILIFILPLHELTLFVFLAYMIVRNVIGHLGFEILPKGFTKNKWLNWNTSITHHNMHHKNFSGNYGLYFTWWDNLMKTTDEKYHETFDEVKSRPRVCDLNSKPKKSITAIILVLVCSSALTAQSVEGKWMTYNEETGLPLSVIEIVNKGKTIEGKVSRIYLEPSQGEDPVCTKCSGERKSKKVIGMEFMWGFKADGDSWSGKILDPQNGEIYNSKIWLDDERTLRVRGYGGVLDLFYRTQTWKREAGSKEKSLIGFWLTLDDSFDKVKSRVEIVEKNGVLTGYIRKIFLLPHEGTDPLCVQCEGDLKNEKIVGMKILYSFKKNGEKWEDGKILDPGNGHVYTSVLWLLDDTTLKVRGYFGPFYRSQTWKRL